MRKHVRTSCSILRLVCQNCVKQTSRFDAEDITNKVWLLTKPSVRNVKHVSSDIVTDNMAHVKQHSTQHLSNTAWAFARLGFLHDPLLKALSSASISRIRDFSEQGQASTVWAVSSLRFCHKPLIQSIASSARPSGFTA